MDRSLDETIAERQRGNQRGGRRGPPPSRRPNNNFPRDGIRKSNREERTNLDNDWVHDRYEDEAPPARDNYSRSRGRRDDRRDDVGRDRTPEPDRGPPPAKIRVENLHYDLTEDDIHDLFTRIAPVMDAKLRYDRAGRSEGVAFVTYKYLADARTAIREFDGANAKGQPIRLALLPPPKRDNPFDKVENPRSLFDRIEAPGNSGGGRDRERRRSQSPRSDVEMDDRGGYRRGPRRGGGGGGGNGNISGPSRDRRSDISKPVPENIDRYIPGQTSSRSSSHRGGGRRPGERRERGPPRERIDNGQKTSGGRPKKTQEELDAEMEDYWTQAANTSTGDGSSAKPGYTSATTTNQSAAVAEDDIDMIE